MSLADTAGRAPRVIPFPERIYKPNIRACFEVVDSAKGDAGNLFLLANTMLALAAELKAVAGKSGQPSDFQRVVDTIGIAFFCLGTMLGIPRGTVEQVAFGNAPAKRQRVVAEGRFASIGAALKRQKRDIARARRRWAALLPAKLLRQSPAGALQAGIEPLRLLQAILDHADMIALDVPDPSHVRKVHLLLTVPVPLLERATAIASYDVDDEDTDGGESDQDKEPDADAEFSLGYPDAIVDQTRKFPASIRVGDTWQTTGDDLELDPAEHEPSLGGIDGALNQEHWADGSRLDRERGNLGGDCDDDEENGDREPEHDEPSLSPVSPGGSIAAYGVIDGEEGGYSHHDTKDKNIRAKLRAERRVGELMAAQRETVGLATGARGTGSNQRQVRVSEQCAPLTLAEAGIDKNLADRARKLAPLTTDGEPPVLWLPTGNRPDGGCEMRNEATGQTVVWRMLSRNGEAR